jgi:hypothetical protein
MILSLSLVLFVIAQYDSLIGLTYSVSDLHWERSSEGLAISNVQVDGSKLNATATNLGRVPLTIVTLWASQWTGTTSDWHKSFDINVYLAPGNVTKNIGQSLSQNFDSSKIYTVKIVSTRGNIASATYVPLGTVIAPGYVNTGYLTIAFSDSAFKYTKNGSPTLYTAWDPPSSDTCVVWYVEFTNHGAQDIKLYNYSVMSFVQVAVSNVKQVQFFIVHPSVVSVSDCSKGSVISYPSSPIQTIPKNAQGDTQLGGNPIWVKFSATAPGGTNPQTGPWGAGDEYMVFIVMYYRYGPSQDFTQIIPFAGVHFV